MKRVHIHISVDDLDPSIRFYSALFGREPTVRKPAYAKWLLDDPSVNLAISHRPGRAAGVNHLGIQTESAAELTEVHGRLVEARHTTHDERAATCCYARSDKHWALDPTGVTWEVFHTTAESTVYGETVDVPATDRSAVEPARPGCCRTG